jgi:formiminotetrahydrofolate cyclodeaminase
MRGYLDDLAARKPAPGGGSAAALGAATGASLMCMVANYTVGNPKYKNVEVKAAAIYAKAETSRNRLLELVDEDVAAYAKLSKGMKEAGKDAAKSEQLYKEAAGVPFEVCRISAECLKMCEELADIGNKNLVTDTAIAVLFLESAFFSAKFNVYVNLKYIKDLEFVGKMHRALAPLEDGLPKLKEEILEKCEDSIGK